MMKLIFKIFLAYWLAAGVVIIISDIEPHPHIHTPQLMDALNASLAANGRTILHLYESGRCSSDLAWLNTEEHGVYLATPSGTLLCGVIDHARVQELVALTVKENKRTTENHKLYQLIAMPIVAGNGQKYVLLFKTSYSSALHLYGFLPGYTTIAISGVVTLFLAILVAHPIRSLRDASRCIAHGKLETRIIPGKLTRLLARLNLKDDLYGLTEDFNKMAERLQSLVGAQKLLLRDVSHELRSPLARLSIALELTRDAKREDRNVHLARIERESIYLNTLISRVLAFSYIESIRELHNSEELCLAQLVSELLPDVQYEAEGRHCNVVATDLRDCVVYGDCDMLRHALENIVRNAISYTPANGTVEINVDQGEHEGHPMAILRVTDSGPGVAEEKLKLIFNAFYRADSSRRSSSSGFGVGLAIADRAVQLHRGMIIAKNRQSGGLIVEMWLPLTATAA
jgi:two-component system, OmpR family, sensor histidine kinase CpxA